MMPGPSPYNALYAIFGRTQTDETKERPRNIQIIKKSNKHSNKNHKPTNKNTNKVDNSCQTQPLRDYSYDKVVRCFNRDISKTCYQDDNFKILRNDYATFSKKRRSYKEITSITSRSVGIHLKNSHVNAVYKTVSDIKRIFRDAHSLHSHDEKCLCSSCGTLGVVTESLKRPVDFDDTSSENDDDDEHVDKDEDEEYEPLWQEDVRRHYRNEYDDYDSIHYDMPDTETYIKLLLQLDIMKRRVRSLEKLALRHNIPISKIRTNMAFDMYTQYSNIILKKSIRSSNSEVNVKHCGMFSIPKAIKQRFSYKQQSIKTPNTKKVPSVELASTKKVKPTTLRSQYYKYKHRNDPKQINKETSMDFDDINYHVLNDDEMCELMFHLNKNSQQKNQKTTIPPPKLDKEIDTTFLYKKPQKQKKHEVKPFNMGPVPVGLRSTIDKACHDRSIRNDKVFIRRSPNYPEEQQKSNCVNIKRNLFEELLERKAEYPTVKQLEQINTPLPCQKPVTKDSIMLNKTKTSEVIKINKGSDTVAKLNIDISKFYLTSEKKITSQNDLQTSKLFTNTTFSCNSSNTTNESEKQWITELLQKSVEILQQQTNALNIPSKISDCETKSKVGKSVTYSKENEYRYFMDSLMDIESNLETYYDHLEIGESSGINKNIYNNNIENEAKITIEQFAKSRIPTALRVRSRSSSPPQLRSRHQSKTVVNEFVKFELTYDVGFKRGTKKKVKTIPIYKNNVNKIQYNIDQITYKPHWIRGKNEIRANKSGGTSKKIDSDDRTFQYINSSIFQIPTIKENAAESQTKLFKSPTTESKCEEIRKRKQWLDINEYVTSMKYLENYQYYPIQKKKYKRSNNMKKTFEEMRTKQENKDIIKEIHECYKEIPLRRPQTITFENPYFSESKHKAMSLKLEKRANKSILKTYKRVGNDTSLKLNPKNSILINKSNNKKGVNINQIKKVSSSVVLDIFNRKTSHNVVLTKIFKRKKSSHRKGEEKKKKPSKIPIPLNRAKLKTSSTKSNTKKEYSASSKFVSKIPVPIKNKSIINKPTVCNKVMFKEENLHKQSCQKVFFNCTTFVNKPFGLNQSLKKYNSNTTKQNYTFGNPSKCCSPKSILPRQEKNSKIPIFSNKPNKQNIISTYYPGKSNNIKLNCTKALLNSKSFATDMSFLPKITQNINLYHATISIPVKKSKAKLNVGEIVEENKNTNLQILPAKSDILSNYNSQIEIVEKRMSNAVTISSNTINSIPSSSYSEDNENSVFIYQSQYQIGNNVSIEDSEFDSRISDFVYTSKSNSSTVQPKKKWKWMKSFAKKLKSFLSVQAHKTTTLDSSLDDVVPLSNGNKSTSTNSDGMRHFFKNIKETVLCIPSSSVTIKTVETKEICKGTNFKEPVNAKITSSKVSRRKKWYNKAKVSSSNINIT